MFSFFLNMFALLLIVMSSGLYNSINFPALSMDTAGEWLSALIFTPWGFFATFLIQYITLIILWGNIKKAFGNDRSMGIVLQSILSGILLAYSFFKIPMISLITFAIYSIYLFVHNFMRWRSWRKLRKEFTRVSVGSE
ncbi:hypothetical protein L1765_05835 [Microaerobacter geothermalis]|uniref:hypothetical protein n=1 Tax=Microaerobacter geothermalis TaxID=674972 RepID=UPI001F162668|nr:hypothetical protein [Microaerobacter geothermalis]MCF6093506.1 hypothetical protein [Microaerobacter geothermalis]